MPKNVRLKGRFCTRSNRGFMVTTMTTSITIPLAVLVLAFIMQTSIYLSASIKAAAMTKQIAMFAANSEPTNERTHNCRLLAERLLVSSGLLYRLSAIDVEDTVLNGDDAVRVKTTVSVPVLNVIPTFPPFMSTEHASTIPLPVNRVCGCIALCPEKCKSGGANNFDRALYVPIIRPRTTLSVWSTPFDSVVNSLRITQGASPSPPNCSFNLLDSTFKSLY